MGERRYFFLNAKNVFKTKLVQAEMLKKVV